MTFFVCRFGNSRMSAAAESPASRGYGFHLAEKSKFTPWGKYPPP
jgi:hypothetical protein